MTTYFLHSLKIISKRFALLLVSVVMLLGLMQPAALAASSNAKAEPGFAPGITQPVPGEQIDQLKEQRREWQSKASSLHDARDNESDSLGETLKEKLNLDEITEGYDPKRESEKAYQRDPLGTR
jgi:hypothetical protein